MLLLQSKGQIANVSNSSSKRDLLAGWLIFVSIFVFYAATYARYGIENNDTGFILGLAHQLFMGEKFYKDIIYVRPPLSPILHSIVFYFPLSYAPIYFDRLITYIEVALCSILSARVAQKYCGWSELYTCCVASLAFIFSQNVFPAMAWHTTDGVFFSVVAVYLYLKSRESKSDRLLFLSAIAAVFAALSKQSFYTTPVLLFTMTFLNESSPKELIKICFFISVATAGIVLCLQPIAPIQDMLPMITCQTRIGDAFSAGVMSFVHALRHLDGAICATTLICCLVISRKFLNHVSSLADLPVLFFVCAYFVYLLLLYVHLEVWSPPTRTLDTIFTVTLCYIASLWYERKDPMLLTLLSLYGIAWASALSWGYQTTALYQAPNVIFFAILLEPYISKHYWTKACCTLFIPLSIFVFYLGNSQYYSLEKPLQRSTFTADMSNASLKFRYIMSSPRTLLLYEELIAIIRSNQGEFIVLPNIPLAHLLVGVKNPIGVDWALDQELGKTMGKTALGRTNAFVKYAIVYRGGLSWLRGSDLLSTVTNHWVLSAWTDNFLIYKNPHIIAARVQY